ncbi:Hypothetical protein FKW44_014186 [Caligus rogercresseyi]|uniref:Uncharacterized protein n=1 Tax=Caligus rogercresseyi TaxID=217165 RepID=A0A7T8JYU3_CALRO|nr:Hypothetical protein FKW44_014186 [Caligus rogercresseyi]
MSHEKKNRKRIADLLKSKVDKKRDCGDVGCSLATVYNVSKALKMENVLVGLQAVEEQIIRGLRTFLERSRRQ